MHPSVAAATLGTCMVERHLTLDRAMWGSGQAASIEPQGLRLMVRNMRTIPVMLGSSQKRVLESEKPVRKKLRRADYKDV